MALLQVGCNLEELEEEGLADRGFVMSDHADWLGLLQAIKSTGAENIITTHGYTDVFSRYLNEIGYNAVEEKTLFTGESIDTEEELETQEEQE